MSETGFGRERLYRHESVLKLLRGMGRSLLNSLTPMIAIMGVLALMYSSKSYLQVLSADRELFTCTVMYIFIFSMILHSTLSTPISHYVGDMLFSCKTREIRPAYYLGLVVELGVSAIVGGAFYLLIHFDGGVDATYAALSYMMFMSYIMVLYNMIFLSASKDFTRLVIYFLVGMAMCYIFSRIFFLMLPLDYAMLAGFASGFTLIAALQYALIRKRFPDNSHDYKAVLKSYKTTAMMTVSYLLYSVGLFAHNFVYWGSEALQMQVSKYYFSAPTYDQACFVAVLTSVLSSISFAVRIEDQFMERFQSVSYTVLKGRLVDVDNAVSRMFRMKNYIVSNVLKAHFIIAAGGFFLITVILPSVGLYGLTTEMYPCVAAAYFVMYEMYYQLMLLSYFDDQAGMLAVCAAFLVLNVVVTYFVQLYLPIGWQGLGFFTGSLIGLIIANLRLKWIQRNFYDYTFCTGDIVTKRYEPMPDNCVYHGLAQGGANT